MQFGDGGEAYTLLVRDSSRCKRFFGLLTGEGRTRAKTRTFGNGLCRVYEENTLCKRLFYFVATEGNSISPISPFLLVTLVTSVS